MRNRLVLLLLVAALAGCGSGPSGHVNSDQALRDSKRTIEESVRPYEEQARRVALRGIPRLNDYKRAFAIKDNQEADGKSWVLVIMRVNSPDSPKEVLAKLNERVLPKSNFIVGDKGEHRYTAPRRSESIVSLKVFEGQWISGRSTTPKLDRSSLGSALQIEVALEAK